MSQPGSRSVGARGHKPVRVENTHVTTVRTGEVTFAVSHADSTVALPSSVKGNQALPVHRHQRSHSNASQQHESYESIPLAERMRMGKSLSVQPEKLQEQLLITLRHQLIEILREKRKKQMHTHDRSEAAAAASDPHHHDLHASAQEELETVYNYFLTEDREVREGSPLQNLSKLFSLLAIPESIDEQTVFFRALEKFTKV